MIHLLGKRSLEDSSVIESYRKTLWVSHLEN